MKQILLCAAAALFICTNVNAQAKPKTPIKTAGIKPMPGQNAGLKNSLDSFSYALGMNIANNLKAQSIDEVSLAAMQKGMDDIFKQRKPALTEEQSNMCVQKKLQESSGKKSGAEKAKGKAFLDANKKRKEVTTLPNGLQYEVLKKGEETGLMPTAQDTFVAHYAGTLIDGKEFDNSYKRGEPLSLPVTSVIPGWTQILQMMHVGDKWKVFIPSDLGYGDRGAGQDIPGGATLIFEMELVGVKKAAAIAPVEEKKQK
jgi:FKBP-type peptidyl-prolyl cis-trans isomerase FklB